MFNVLIIYKHYSICKSFHISHCLLILQSKCYDIERAENLISNTLPEGHVPHLYKEFLNALGGCSPQCSPFLLVACALT